jgi:hypothetical protein
MGIRALVVKSTGIFKVSFFFILFYMFFTVRDAQDLTWLTYEKGKETIFKWRDTSF